MFGRAKQLVVTSYHPWRKWVFLAVMAVSLPLGAWGLFDYGRARAGFDSDAASRERSVLLTSIEGLQEGNDALRQQVATLKQAGEIDKQAYADVNASLEAMQTEILELKEEVAFYRGIVAPQESSQGVRVQSLQLIGNGGERGYSYKLVLVQATKDASVARGEVKVMVHGVSDQTPTEYTFEELSGKTAQGEKFRFKYFEKTEGDIVLPENFIPTRVVVHVTVDSPKQTEVEAVYAWQDLVS